MPVLNPSWLPICRMERIIVHWTAGTYNVSYIDKQHYHFIIDKFGEAHAGNKSLKGNARAFANQGSRTSHTRNLNTGSIGISVACMGGAVEHPFSAGLWPLREVQWDALMQACSELCKKYRLPASPKTLLMHGEVEDNLGVDQLGKWDIGRLPFDMQYKNCAEVGTYMRDLVVNMPKAKELSIEEGEDEEAVAHDLNEKIAGVVRSDQ